MLTRRLALKLLAPTVLVSMALVSACILGAMYLNALHVNISKELTENVQSTQAASRLETTAKEVSRLLRGDHRDPAGLDVQVMERNRAMGELLGETQRLANLPREQELVQQITVGMSTYLQGWDVRPTSPPSQLVEHDVQLAEMLERDVLRPCIDLRNYNTDQIEASDRDNRVIVQRLTWGLLLVGIGAPLSGLLLGYAVARGLHHSIYQLSVGIRDAAGRLNRELGSVTVEEDGDLPGLERRMQDVVAEIERVVGQLQQREREVLRAEQLAAVGQVASGVAHELRNPLTSVKMLVQTGLEGERPSGLPPEDLAIIEHEIRRMEACIQTFIDFARPPRSERRQADLVEVVQRSLTLMEGRAHRQKVTLRADLPSAPLPLFIDPDQIHQVLINLLLNALDALPRGGTVELTVSNPQANGKPDRTVEVRVCDSGPGIAPRIQERLFEPFVSSKETGLGLGLSICKRLIEVHGGAIRGANDPVGGAVFTFTLPVDDKSV